MSANIESGFKKDYILAMHSHGLIYSNGIKQTITEQCINKPLKTAALTAGALVIGYKIASLDPFTIMAGAFVVTALIATGIGPKYIVRMHNDIKENGQKAVIDQLVRKKFENCPAEGRKDALINQLSNLTNSHRNPSDAIEDDYVNSILGQLSGRIMA